MDLVFERRDPNVKVTFLGKGYGIRLFHLDGHIWDETFVETRLQVGPACRDLLRWWDKMGGISKYADRARHRSTEKEMFRKGYIKVDNRFVKVED